MYFITAGNTDTDFTLAPTTGVITVANTLTASTKPSYGLTILATPGGGNSAAGSTTVYVYVCNCPSSAIRLTTCVSMYAAVLLAAMFV